ncbi:hypothetical protein P152DRAFT_462346 [Eremomyces bilateralis CBS 781.70]|uniref:Uncharacterized protein n=1 Tax=Eremomyces bilateralis CBS 781.70 TaxID=1392243 RepID=A0A6G1FSH0_9PEZI|nr:uncharacterized protein P152DRAFT_462346 [Eremomyces bilateralis CBS 781.70]KAF1808622.1 hypothetical protein P152DRAFT_462346 [Eremomyces bilateralis CBS 781.70]
MLGSAALKLISRLSGSPYKTTIVFPPSPFSPFDSIPSPYLILVAYPFFPLTMAQDCCSRAAKAWQEAKATVHSCRAEETVSHRGWTAARDYLQSVLGASPPRSNATGTPPCQLARSGRNSVLIANDPVKKARQSLEKKREIYEWAKDRRVQAEGRRDEAFRRLEAEEAARLVSWSMVI